jgi:Domain of unknown function (DUF4372)
VNSGRTVFSQLIQHLPEKEFQNCVARYNGDSNFRALSCWDQLLAMACAQLIYGERLRDIESCLRAALQFAEQLRPGAPQGLKPCQKRKTYSQRLRRCATQKRVFQHA